MKTTIQLFQSNNREIVLNVFFEIIENSNHLQEQLKIQGVLFELDEPRQVATVKNRLDQLNYSSYTSTETSVSLLAPNGDLEALLTILKAILLAEDDVAKLLWGHGIILEDITQEDAQTLKEKLEAESAQVTIANNEPQHQFMVSGRVLRHDNTPFTEEGYTVRALDAISDTNTIPLNTPINLSANGTYQIAYGWQSTGGRNGPNLLVRLFNSEGTIVTEATKMYASRQETLDLIIDQHISQTYTISGIVQNRANNNPLSNVAITATFRANNQVILSQSSQTNANGTFTISFGQNLFDNQTLPIEVSFRLSQNNQSLQTTTTIPNLLPLDQTITILATLPESGELPFIVRGTLMHADGQQAEGFIIRGYDIDLRTEELLAETKTNASGYYEFHYSSNQFARNEKASADVRVTAFNTDGEEVARSRIYFNAEREENIDLIIGNEPYRGPSEFDIHVAALTPVLGDISISQLEETEKHQDVTFLNGETGIPKIRIEQLIAAHQFGERTDIPPQIYYGWFRKDLPMDLPALLIQDPSLLKRSIEAAAADNIIAPHFTQEIDDILSRLKDLLIRETMNPISGERGILISVLGTVLDRSEQQEAFLRKYMEHTGQADNFWDELSESEILSEYIGDLRFTMGVAAFSGNHLPLIRELQQYHRNHEIASTQDLVRFDENGWMDILERPNPEGDGVIGAPETVPGDGQEKLTTYAGNLAALFERAFPTPFVVARLQQEGREQDRNLITVLKDNQGSFDLNGPRFETYLANHPNALNSIAEVQRPAVKEQLRKLQRTYRVAMRYKTARVLLDEGIDSADAIERKGSTMFALKYGHEKALGDVTTAKLIHNRAVQIRAFSTALIGNIGMNTSVLPLTAVPEDRPGEIEGVPDWRALFGSLDMCECEHCRSVHSPAAYLVDILSFLKDRELVDRVTIVRDEAGIITSVRFTDRTAQEILFDRRGDIGDIELTCENTNTPLPYIDLVNEVMEDFVSPPPPFSSENLDEQLISDLDQRRLSDELKEAFNPPLSSYAEIKIEKPGERWRIHDRAFSYTLRLVSNADGVQVPRIISRSRQTRGTAQELAANPQYLNPEAYEKLSNSIFPIHLPYDLWSAEVRSYLGHLKVTLHTLLEAFQPGERMALLQNAHIAHEYLGLTAAEAKLITVPEPGQPAPQQWELWGFPAMTLNNRDGLPDPAGSTYWIQDGQWLEVLTGRVDVFLQQSGLKYKEMLSLLGTYFVNPKNGDNGRLITVEALRGEPATCDLKNLEIRDMNETAALRALHFIRLCRKLNWTMQDLDRTLTALDKRVIDNEFLIQLSHIERLRQSLNLPVEKLLPFWSLIDSAFYLNHDASEQPPFATLYDKLFRNKTVVNPPDQAFTEDPAAISGEISAHLATISAGLGISSADLELLRISPEILPHIGDPALPDDRLSIENLSKLYRHVTLARALKLQVSDYLSAIILNGNPFINTAETILFVERINIIRTTGFTMAELDYLTRHKFDTKLRLAPEESLVAQTFEEMRKELQRISTENVFIEEEDDPVGATIDHDGQLTKQKLALLGWDNTLVEAVVTTLAGNVEYRAPLEQQTILFELPPDIPALQFEDGALHFEGEMTASQRDALLAQSPDPAFRRAINQLFNEPDRAVPLVAFPSGVRLPVEDIPEISFTADALRFHGLMTVSQRDTLLDLSTDTNFQNAVRQLFEAPRRFVRRHMRSFTIEHFSAPLEVFPEDVEFPSVVKDNIYYAADEAKLYFIGAMNEDQRELLLELVLDDAIHRPYRDAINALYTAPDASATNDVFLTSSGTDPDVTHLIDNEQSSKDRYIFLLRKLLPYLRRTLSESAVVQGLSESLGMETKTIRNMLLHYLKHSDRAREPLMETFLQLAKIHPGLPITGTAFPELFHAYLRLHKVVLIAKPFRATARQMGWLFEYHSSAGWPNLTMLPTVEQSDPVSNLEKWVALTELFYLRDRLPGGEVALGDLLRQAAILDISSTEAERNAAKEQYLVTLSKWTEWPLSDLTTLLGQTDDHLQTGLLEVSFPEDYLGAKLLVRLHTCFKLLRHLGLSAEQCRNLLGEELDDVAAYMVKQAVRAKYDETQWLKLARGLRDPLREQQRAALVAYLLANPNEAHSWRDVNDIYSYFLLDVEMSSCQLTSRIKQAISSVQLFVQRCLMNLEPQVLANDEIDVKWNHWRWMKNYRVWEANLKIFLYPENWIEPELRDDKSPLFISSEGQLLQNDLTQDAAEDAYRSYLDQLDAIARLEVVGMYHQLEKDASGNTKIDVMHVFGRTMGSPQMYFYRRWVNQEYWTPWEKIDLDIEGDHLIPAVWRGRLYLIWPIFTKEAKPVDPSQAFTNPAPEERWKIQLAWSEYRDSAWLPKKVSTDSVNSQYVVDIASYAPKSSYFFLIKVFIRLIQSSNGLPMINYERNLALEIMVIRYDPELGSMQEGKFSLRGCNSEFLPTRSVEEIMVAFPSNTHPYFMSFQERDTAGGMLNLPYKIINRFKLSDSVALKQTTPGHYSLLSQSSLSLSQPSSLFFYIADHVNILTRPWFFNDEIRTYFVIPKQTTLDLFSPIDIDSLNNPRINNENAIISRDEDVYIYQFQTFYHPFVCQMIEAVDRNGIDGALHRSLQLESDGAAVFKTYQPEYGIFKIIDPQLPIEEFDFNHDGAYAHYNWELFFHLPLLIANSLHQNQRFAEAQRWFHYIFDPTDTSGTESPQRYWGTKPFFLRTCQEYQRQHIMYLMQLLASGGNIEISLTGIDDLTRAQLRSDYENLVKAVNAWRNDPFKPHLVARTRTVAYQKNVVMKYLDNLIAWGDQLFRRDTLESINEATQLYILASEILGKRPEEIPPRALPVVQTYNTLSNSNDLPTHNLNGEVVRFPNAWVEIEEFVPPSAVGSAYSGDSPLPRIPKMMYFCIPKNDKLLGYWDTIADRLFKIRHCMNIEGVVRQLPLFEPPIDPALLVKAVAAGVDIGSVLNDINASSPHYRFNVLAQKATELCNEVRSLGASLLATLEKRDAEALALMRAEHEIALLQEVEEVRKQQLEEAEKQILVLEASHECTATRYTHYQRLLGIQEITVPPIPDQNQEPTQISELAASGLVAILDESGVKMIGHEKEELLMMKRSTKSQKLASQISQHSSIAHIVPNFNIAPYGCGATFGGANVGSALSAVSTWFQSKSNDDSYLANRSSKLAQMIIRENDWLLQSNSSAREIYQIDQQIVAARLRREIADQELQNHRKQIEQAEKVEEFMRDKYTNQELYNWMIGRISTVYFQAYQMAFDTCKRAERAFQRELGVPDTSFIQFGYWDSLKKGLLAADRMHHDLKRMELAYLDQHSRRHEVTKHISLAQLDPLQLIQLRETGNCEFWIPEFHYDLDFPGHYCRYIKTVSLTIPCVIGPYTNISAKLTLLGSRTRVTTTGTTSANEYPFREDSGGDPRFIVDFTPQESIVTSNAQNDSGLFEFSLRDERFLPFEGRGAISRWRLELCSALPQFDYDTISDAILHIRFTAKDDGRLSEIAKEYVNANLNQWAQSVSESGEGLWTVFSLRQSFSSQFHRFLYSAANETVHEARLNIEPRHFPYFLRGKNFTILEISVIFKLKEVDSAPLERLRLQIGQDPLPALNQDTTVPLSIDSSEVNPSWGGLPVATFSSVSGSPIGEWVLRINSTTPPMNPNVVEDIFLAMRFEVEAGGTA